MILIMNGLNLCMNELLIKGFNIKPDSNIIMSRYGANHYYSIYFYYHKKYTMQQRNLFEKIENKYQILLLGRKDTDFPCLVEANLLFGEDNE